MVQALGRAGPEEGLGAGGFWKETSGNTVKGWGPETGRETQGIMPAALRGAGHASGLRTVPRPCCPAWAVRMIAGWQAGRLSSGAQSAAILVSVFLFYKKADTWAKQRCPVQASSTRATQTSGSDWASPRETGPRGALGAYSGQNPVGFTPPLTSAKHPAWGACRTRGMG